MLHTNETKIGSNGGSTLLRVKSMTVFRVVKEQFAIYGVGQSNFSGADLWNFHVSELVPGQAICFVILER